MRVNIPALCTTVMAATGIHSHAEAIALEAMHGVTNEAIIDNDEKPLIKSVLRDTVTRMRSLAVSLHDPSEEELDDMYDFYKQIVTSTAKMSFGSGIERAAGKPVVRFCGADNGTGGGGNTEICRQDGGDDQCA